MHGTRQTGFTLLELLVAMAIFAIIGVLALGGLNSVATQQALARASLEELSNLQRAVRYLTGDLAQTYPRWVRDEIGAGMRPPLLTDPGQQYLIELTRGGWRNPANLPRGHLQRVRYRLEDGRLTREYWPVVDRPLGMEPRVQTLLTDVEELRIELLADDGQWQAQWPPLSASGGSVQTGPRAARITLTVAGQGEIERVVEMVP